MRNLLEIETGLLSSDAVKTGLQLTKVKSLQKSIKTAERTKFRKSLEMATLMRQGKEWFDLPTTQILFSEQGIVWSAEELADKVFELSKTRMYRYIKASNVAEDVVQVFERQCKHLQDSGESVSMCIDSLNQFAKAYAVNEDVNVADLQATETESVGTDTIEEATEEATAETTSDTIFTLSYKLNAVNNVAVRYSATDGLVTTNSEFEIKQAILFLQEQLNNL
mgnify:FL=1|tara:strand:+ start:114 stop:782 length:669 start_codon:yes stop_codon:yes gene_type:complete